MRLSKIKNIELYQRAVELSTIGNRGVQLAIAEDTFKRLPLYNYFKQYNQLPIAGWIYRLNHLLKK
jgi:hypothetical protein